MNMKRLIDNTTNQILIYSVLVVILCLFYNVTSFLPLIILSLLIMMWVFFRYQVDNLFLFLAFLIPNIYSIKFLQSTSSIVSYYMILVLFKYVITNKGISLSKPFLIMGTSLCVCCFVTLYHYSELSYLVKLFRFGCFLILILIMANKDEFKNKSYKFNLLETYAYGVVLSIITGLLYYCFKGLNIFDGYFSGIRNDRNFFSSIFPISICVLMYLWVCKEKKISYLIGIVIVLIGGLLSNSRAFILGLAVSFLYGISLIISFKVKFNWKHLLCLIALLVLFFFSPIWGKTIPRIINRFSGPRLMTGSGRTTIWKTYLSMSVSSIFRFVFGNGPFYLYTNSGIVSQQEHNIFIEMFSTFGLLGLSLIIALFIYIRNSILDSKKSNIVYLFPLFSVLVCYSFISQMFEDQATLALFVSFLLERCCADSSGVLKNENHSRD